MIVRARISHRVSAGALLCLVFLVVASLGLAQDTTLSGHTAYLYGALDSWWLDTSRAVGLLQDPYPEARALAARVLACNPDPNRLRLFREYLKDTNPWVRQAAMIGVGRLGPIGVEMALDGLDDRTPLVRQAAAWAAAHCGPRALEALSGVLLTERDQAVRETALGNMWRFGDAVWEPHVGRYAVHEDPILRRAAAFSLGRSLSERRTAALMTLCWDDEPVIRATAISGLAAGPINVAERGLVIRGLSDADWRVRVAACRVLAARPELELSSDQGRVLAGLWTDGRAQLAVVALEAGGAHPGAGSDKEIRKVMIAAEPWPAAEALRALARRNPDSAAEHIARWSGDEEIWRRRAAARAAIHLPAARQKEAVSRIVGDPEPAVRLAWLEAADLGDLPDGEKTMWSIVDSDTDPAVRTQALDNLRQAGAADDPERLLDLYDRWLGDTAADARGAALAAALVAGNDELRTQVLELADRDPDPVVSALVVAEARKQGLEVVIPAREPRHGEKWYRDLQQWSTIGRWMDVVTVRGTFRILLSSRDAPITAREIWTLAREGFYDGLTFHRVVSNFVVQGGDPRGDGWGGPGFALPDEITMRPFDSWRVGVATAGPNTGGSQFFVTPLPADHLTGHYTNFGEVVAGRDVVGRLQAGDRIVRVETFEGDEPEPITPVVPDKGFVAPVEGSN